MYPGKENAIATAAVLPPPTRLTTLILWHLLSLDAPTVAVVWTLFAARALHAQIPRTLAPAMFLAVWLLYTGDRLLDTLRPKHALQPRHLYPRTHLLPFAFAMLIAFSALAILTPTLPTGLLGHYLLLAAILFVWFALIHLTSLRLPKEFVTGLFFAAAVFLPFHTSLLHPILFAALCILNCLYIYRWEHPRVPHLHHHFMVIRVGFGRRPTAPGQVDAVTNPHPTTRIAIHHLHSLTLALAFLSLAAVTPVTIAITLSALALVTLDHYRHTLQPTHLRAAADLALLTPALVLPFLP